MLCVRFIAEGNDGIDSVIAAIELDDDEDAGIGISSGGAGHVVQECGDERGKGHKAGTPQEMTSGDHGLSLRELGLGCGQQHRNGVWERIACVGGNFLELFGRQTTAEEQIAEELD